MTIEDRVRRVLTEAVADEPPPKGSPLAAVRRRRRRRPVLVGAAALLLALAAVLSLVAVREARGPLPSTDPTAGWKIYTDTARNLQLRYPPDWVLGERQPGWVRIAPPEQAAKMLEDFPPFALGVRAPAAGYYLGEQTGVEVTRGRLPSGQAFTVTEEDPVDLELPAGTKVARSRTYSIDWGRTCTTSGARPGCGTRVVRAGLSAEGRASPLWDRYRGEAEAIVATIAPLTPVAVLGGPWSPRLPSRSVAAVPPRRVVLRRPRPTVRARRRVQVPRGAAVPPGAGVAP